MSNVYVLYFVQKVNEGIFLQYILDSHYQNTAKLSLSLMYFPECVLRVLATGGILGPLARGIIREFGIALGAIQVKKYPRQILAT
jgi:hypothetical protein